MTRTTNLEKAATEALQSVGESCQEYRSCCEDKIRNAPLAAVACAASVGYLVHILPITAIVGTLLRVLFFLLRPALVIVGAVKLYELFSQTTIVSKAFPSEESEPLVDSPQGPAQKKPRKG